MNISGKLLNISCLLIEHCKKVEELHKTPGMNMQVIDLLKLKTKDMLEKERICLVVG